MLQERSRLYILIRG